MLIVNDLHELKNFHQVVSEDSTLLLAVSKDTVFVGPFFIRGASVCFSCLTHWLATAGFDSIEFRVPDESDLRLAINLLAEAGAEYSETGKIFGLKTAIQSFTTDSGKYSAHPIYPLRDCPSCASVDCSEWPGLRMHCSSLTGIVQKMEITREPIAGAFRAIGTWNSPLPVVGKRPLLARQQSHGRGATREQAELGCIGEALERYSLIYRGDETLLRARMSDIHGIDPRDILLYSERQYQFREQWNAEADERYFVGEEFDPDSPIEWFPAMDLFDGQDAFVPAACTLMWYQFPDGEAEFARADTIGCGSGRTFEDALAHALFEWIERDAMAIWWYNRIRRPSVCLDSFDMPELLRVRDSLSQVGRELVLLDCTTDLCVPTYVSIATRPDGSEPLFAGASHLSPRVAAWKAASEVGQLWFTMAHNKNIDSEMKRWLANTTTQPYIQPTHEIEAPQEPPALGSNEQVARIVDRLKKAGLHPYAADLSRSDVILKTARAVVPGLRHIWNRRAPGRLYDVPVRLGWLDRPLEEDELNSICCMI